MIDKVTRDFVKYNANKFSDMIVKGDAETAKAEFVKMRDDNYALCGNGGFAVYLLIGQIVPIYVHAKLGKITRKQAIEAQNVYFDVTKIVD